MKQRDRHIDMGTCCRPETDGGTWFTAIDGLGSLVEDGIGGLTK